MKAVGNNSFGCKITYPQLKLPALSRHSHSGWAPYQMLDYSSPEKWKVRDCLGDKHAEENMVGQLRFTRIVRRKIFYAIRGKGISLKRIGFLYCKVRVTNICSCRLIKRIRNCELVSFQEKNSCGKLSRPVQSNSLLINLTSIASLHVTSGVMVMGVFRSRSAILFFVHQALIKARGVVYLIS